MMQTCRYLLIFRIKLWLISLQSQGNWKLGEGPLAIQLASPWESSLHSNGSFCYMVSAVFYHAGDGIGVIPGPNCPLVGFHFNFM